MSTAACAVFVSHSHVDRQVALSLTGILQREGAHVYLDQERIRPGDNLPNELSQGIRSSDVFLLLWSEAASQSPWVQREWQLAHEYHRRIVPYLLQNCPFPNKLDQLVYVHSSDAQLAHAGLLNAVFGRGFVPVRPQVFPGKWTLECDAFGQASARFDLEFRENGQVTGQSGKIALAAERDILALDPDLGAIMQNALAMSYTINGSWSYDSGTRMLTLRTAVKVLGQSHEDSFQIIVDGETSGVLIGREIHGRKWKLQRRDLVAPARANPVQSREWETLLARNHEEKAKADLEKGNFKSALDHADEAIRLNPGIPRTFEIKAMAHRKFGQHEEEERAYLRIEELTRYNPLISWRVARSQLEQNKVDLAVPRLERLASNMGDLDPILHQGLWFSYGKALQETGHPTEAITALDRADKCVSPGQEKPNTAFYRARALEQLGRFAEAVAEYRLALSSLKDGTPEPARTALRGLIGMALVMAGCFAEGVNTLEGVVKSDVWATEGAMHYYLAIGLANLHQHERVLPSLQRAFELNANLKESAKQEPAFRTLRETNAYEFSLLVCG